MGPALQELGSVAPSVTLLSLLCVCPLALRLVLVVDGRIVVRVAEVERGRRSARVDM